MNVVLLVFYVKCPASIQGEELSCWTAEGRVKAWLSSDTKLVSIFSEISGKMGRTYLGQWTQSETIIFCKKVVSAHESIVWGSKIV